MSEELLSFDGFDISELSDEDLAILQAFEAMDTWSTGQSQTDDQSRMSDAPQTLSPLKDEEMLLMFSAEAEEDVASIRRILDQLAQDEMGNLALFTALKRIGHKIRGAAGAVGSSLVATIADHIELLAQGVSYRAISADVATKAISAATAVLGHCLEEITSASEEIEAISLLTTLATAYRSLHIDLQQLEQMRAVAHQIDTRSEKLLQSILGVGSQSGQVVQDRETQKLSARQGLTDAMHISSEDLEQGSPYSSVGAWACPRPASPLIPPSMEGGDKPMPLQNLPVKGQPYPGPVPTVHVFEELAGRLEKLVEQRPTVEDALAQVVRALQELDLAQARLRHLEPLLAKLPGAENDQNMLQCTIKEAVADLASATANVQSVFTYAAMLQQDYLVSITGIYKDTVPYVPHAHKSVHGLLVRVGDQHLLIPFNQIQRISNEQQEQTGVRYSLQELLGFPASEQPRRDRACQVSLIPAIRGGILQAGIVVDEILAEQECIVKPLVPCLQRPGIMGTTIDGKGCVVLIVDLLELIRKA